jgi:hypothetical protein
VNSACGGGGGGGEGRARMQAGRQAGRGGRRTMPRPSTSLVSLRPPCVSYASSFVYLKAVASSSQKSSLMEL